MVNQLMCLKAGGLVLGVIGSVVAMINVFWAIAMFEEIPIIQDNFLLGKLLGNFPDHIIRLFYVTLSVFDLMAAALLIAGILMVNKSSKYFIG